MAATGFAIKEIIEISMMTGMVMTLGNNCIRQEETDIIRNRMGCHTQHPRFAHTYIPPKRTGGLKGTYMQITHLNLFTPSGLSHEDIL